MIDEFDDPGEIIDPTEVKRDRWQRPLLPPVNLALPRAEGDERPFTRVTTFASALGDESNLTAWKMRMVAKGMAEREDLRLLARSADASDKDELNEVAEAAFEIAGGNAGRRLGTAFHKFSEIRDRGGPDSDIDPEFLPHVNAYSAAIEAHGIEVLPDYIERLCVWERFSVAGSFDNIVMWQGQPTILDKKGGADLGYSWLKIAVQLLCYASADGIWDQENYRWLPMPEGLRQDVALVAHVPTGKRGEDARCDIYEIDLTSAGEAIRTSYEAREWLKTRNLAVKLKPAPRTSPVEMPGLGNREVRLRSDGVEVKPLSAQITEAVLAANEEDAPKPEPKKRGRPRKLASVPPPVEPLSFDEPLADVDAVSETDSGIRVSIEVLECATLDETIKAAETEPVAAGPGGRCTFCGQEHSEAVCPESEKEEEPSLPSDVEFEPADPFAALDDEEIDPFADVIVSGPLPTPQEIIITRINEAMGHADLSQIRKEALADGLWTDEMLKLGMARLESLK
jgi:hypothetical protein